MIIVKLMGGLANQMFQYAAGRSLAIKRGSELKLDNLTYFEDQPPENTPRHYELECYPIAAKLISAKDLATIKQVGQPVPKSLFAKFGRRPSLVRLDEHSEPFQSFQPRFFSQTDDVYLDGHWQNEKYFADIRNKLLTELTPKQLSTYTQKLAGEIKGENSVAIHVRRGDYISNKHANKFHGVMEADYYQEALEQIAKQVGKVRCYVFSDDIAWCKDSLTLDSSAVYVTGNGPERGCEDIYLMQQCSHDVIANSSFSWWGAWLNNNPGKIVVAPKNWFRDKIANKKMHIVPDNWIRL